MNGKLLGACAAVLAGLLVATVAADGPESWLPRELQFASTVAANQYAGNALAATADTLVVGAPGSQASSVPGRLFVFRRNERGAWVESQVLQEPDSGGNSGGLGVAVVMDETTIIAGAPTCCTDDGGNVYVYRVSESTGLYSLVQTLRPPASRRQPGQRFGTSLFLRDTMLVVGSSHADVEHEDSGTVDLFQRASATDDFDDGVTSTYNVGSVPPVDFTNGFDVTISEAGTVHSGCPCCTSTLDFCTGMMIKYTYDATFSQVDYSERPFDVEYDFLGASVAAHKDRVLVGAYGYAGNSGAVVIFSATTGGHVTEFQPDQVPSNAQFGRRVRVYEDYVLVRGINGDHNGVNIGSAWLYQFDGTDYQELRRFFPSDEPDDYTGFGTGLAMSANAVFIGAPRASDNRGHVYIYGPPIEPETPFQLPWLPFAIGGAVAVALGSVVYLRSNAGGGAPRFSMAKRSKAKPEPAAAAASVDAPVRASISSTPTIQPPTVFRSAALSERHADAVDDKAQRRRSRSGSGGGRSHRSRSSNSRSRRHSVGKRSRSPSHRHHRSGSGSSSGHKHAVVSVPAQLETEAGALLPKTTPIRDIVSIATGVVSVSSEQAPYVAPRTQEEL